MYVIYINMHENIKKKLFNIEDTNICTICIENITYTKSTILDCSHIYHKECIEKWFTVSYNCPICNNFHKMTDIQYNVLNYILNQENLKKDTIINCLKFCIINELIIYVRRFLVYLEDKDYTEEIYIILFDELMPYILDKSSDNIIDLLIKYCHDFIEREHIYEIIKKNNRLLITSYIETSFYFSCLHYSGINTFRIMYPLIHYTNEYMKTIITEEIINYKVEKYKKIWIGLLHYPYITVCELDFLIKYIKFTIEEYTLAIEKHTICNNIDIVRIIKNNLN